ncbi:MAG: hypothetical protein E7774_14535 [Bradyrhizobium sp.]|nr:MAG: hypothetical protein E7774_14535 [Bradyrhizobium sp.]
MKIAIISAVVLALGCTTASAAPRHPIAPHKAVAPPREAPHPFDAKPGMALTIPISIVDGKVTAGVARLGPLAGAQPKSGEITIGLEKIKDEFYNQITVTEKTAQPIDFLITGLNGGTKIDEIEICGRIDQPVLARIGSVPWRFWVNAFEIGKGVGCNS